MRGRRGRLEVAVVAAGFVAGLAASLLVPRLAEPSARAEASPAHVEPRGRHDGSEAETPGQLAARELARSRSANQRVAPTLAHARRIAATAGRHRRLAGGRRLVVGDVTPTHVVATIELVRGSRPPRSVPADGGVHFAVCAPTRRPCEAPGAGASPETVRAARRHGVELAARTLVETAATVVVVSLPRVAGPPTVLVFERRPLADEEHPRRLLARVADGGGFVDRIVRSHLFTLAGLVAHSPTRDSLVARAIG